MAPTINLLTPAQGQVGDILQIRIDGSGFDEPTVTVNGADAAVGEGGTAISFTISAPAATVAGAVPVVVRNRDGSTADAVFTYSAPVIANVDPELGPEAGGTDIVITGQYFPPNPTVRVGDVAATNVVRISATQVNARTAARLPGANLAVDVLTDHVQNQLAGAFTYVALPTLNAVALALGGAAHGPTAGGTSIRLTGTLFAAGAEVRVGGVNAANVVVVDPMTITADTGPHPALGVVAAAVRNAGGGWAPLVDAFTYEPTITGITPNAGPTCGTQPARIDGAGFADPVTVRIGGQLATGVVRVSATQIDCVTPAHAAGAVDVEVTVGAIPGTLAGGYTFAIPTVTAISPAQGRITGGTWVTITGTQFAVGATVRIGGDLATSVTVVSATTIRCITPRRAAGVENVQVSNTDNLAGVGANLFTYVDGPTATGGNDVLFLMDGEEFFTEFERLVNQLILSGPAALTYLRLAFWKAQGDMTLGAPGHFRNPGHTLLHWIDQIVQAGINVDVILWYPVNIEAVGRRDVKTANAAFAEGIRDLDATAATHAGWGRARAYLEAYEGPAGSSNHQKIAIFSLAGQRTALVGGFNLVHKYYDQVTHMFVDPTENAYTHWHDTAVRIIGPATDDIEREWERRWDRAVAQTRARHEPNQSVIYARGMRSALALNVNNSVRLQAVDLVRNRDAQLAQVANLSVKIATTRSRYSMGRTEYHRELRATLLELIRGAAVSVYMENNQFTDPMIVRELYGAMQATPGLIVAIFTNVHADDPFGWLTRRSWLQLALRLPHPRFTGLTYNAGRGPVPLLRNTLAAFEVQDAYDPNNPTSVGWFSNEWFRYKQNPADPWTQVKLSAITRVDGDFYFYTPVREAGTHRLCLHSKLAIIDARHLVVGTSNWTFRSMEYDGEIAAFIDDAGSAAAVQARLLDHYQQHVLVGRVNLRRAALANLETVADETRAGLAGVRDPNFVDRYCIVRLAHNGWAVVTIAGSGPVVGNHTWI